MCFQCPKWDVASHKWVGEASKSYQSGKCNSGFVLSNIWYVKVVFFCIPSQIYLTGVLCQQMHLTYYNSQWWKANFDWNRTVISKLKREAMIMWHVAKCVFKKARSRSGFEQSARGKPCRQQNALAHSNKVAILHTRAVQVEFSHELLRPSREGGPTRAYTWAHSMSCSMREDTRISNAERRTAAAKPTGWIDRAARSTSPRTEIVALVVV